MTCCNHPNRPVEPPSRVLCSECFAALDPKFQDLKAQLEVNERMIDNAATCSQHRALLEDTVRECITLNIIVPLRDKIAALEKFVTAVIRERDEIDEAIHAAHAATKKILPGYQADYGYPEEAIIALGEAIARLRAPLHNGCLTGDCPHEKNAECDKALSDEVRALHLREQDIEYENRA